MLKVRVFICRLFLSGHDETNATVERSASATSRRRLHRWGRLSDLTFARPRPPTIQRIDPLGDESLAQSPGSLAAIEQFARHCLHGVDDPEHSSAVESPMPTVQAQQARPTQLAISMSLSAFVVSAFVVVPLALFVHGFIHQPAIAEAVALIALAGCFGGVVSRLRATTRAVPPAGSESIEVGPKNGWEPHPFRPHRTPLSIADLMAADRPGVVLWTDAAQPELVTSETEAR